MSKKVLLTFSLCTILMYGAFFIAYKGEAQTLTQDEAKEVELIKLRQDLILEKSDFLPVDYNNGAEIIGEDSVYYTYIGDEVDNAQNIIFDNSDYSNTEKLDDHTYKIYSVPIYYKDDTNIVHKINEQVITKDVWTASKVLSPTEKIIRILKTPYAFASSYYPSLDCSYYLVSSNATWATFQAGSTASGSGCTNTGSTLLAYIQADSTTDRWQRFDRASVIFDTSTITDTDTITASSLFVYGESKVDSHSRSPKISLGGFTPSSYTTANNADWGDFDNTKLAPDITYANWSTTGYNEFVLNATGLATISKTSYTGFGFRQNTDIENTPPTWADNETISFKGYLSEYTGTDHDPYLVVTTEAQATTTPPSETSTTTNPIYAVCTPQTNNDLSLITGCAITSTFSSTTGTSTITTNYVYHIPFFVWIILAIITLFIASRIIIEFIIRWRA